MKALKRKFKGDIGEMVFYGALIALPLAQSAIFYFYVNFNSVMLAFKEFDGKDSFIWNFGANFPQLWLDLTDMTLLNALKNSFISGAAARSARKRCSVLTKSSLSARASSTDLPSTF